MALKTCSGVTHTLGWVQVCDQDGDGQFRKRDGDFAHDPSGKELRPDAPQVREELRRLGIESSLRSVPNLYRHSTLNITEGAYQNELVRRIGRHETYPDPADKRAKRRRERLIERIAAIMAKRRAKGLYPLNGAARRLLARIRRLMSPKTEKIS